MRLVKNLLAFVLVLLVWSCSPKINKPLKPIDNDNLEQGQKSNTPPTKPAFEKARIALLLPFKLHQNNFKTATKAQLDRLDIALDYYQGFLMGLDSSRNLGLNIDLYVHDTQDQAAKIKAIQEQAEVKNAQVIVGPIFPEEIKLFTSFSAQHKVPIISPLAASNPKEYKNPHLISMVNHLGIHAQNIAKYITRHYNAESEVVVLINPGKEDDKAYAQAFKDYLQTKMPQMLIQEYSSIQAFETRMVKGKDYAVFMASEDRSFVSANLDKLQRIAKLKAEDFSIQVFGHPNWVRQNYPIQTLQSLKTVITSAYHVDYKDSEVKEFIKNYRSQFNFEPSEYSFKGYDLGVLLGELMLRYGEDFIYYLANYPFQGIQQHYNFRFEPALGYYNEDLILLQYKHLSLEMVH